VQGSAQGDSSLLLGLNGIPTEVGAAWLQEGCLQVQEVFFEARLSRQGCL